MFMAMTRYLPLMYPIVLSLKAALGCQNVCLLGFMKKGLLNSSCRATLKQEAPLNGYFLRVTDLLDFIFTTVFCQTYYLS